MSKLLSSSNNSNSKNTSYNANGSKENKNSISRDIIKKSNKSFNKSKGGGEISSGNGSIESNNFNFTNNNYNSNSNNNNSNSNNTFSNSNSNSLSNNNNGINKNYDNNNNNNEQCSKNLIIAKRKKFYDKLMKKQNMKKTRDTKDLSHHNYRQKNEEFDSIMKNVPNNNSTSSNIKIMNNTNIIFNVKSGTKSLDIRAFNNNNNKDIMMRDMKELPIITKKAICSISTINPLLDTLDNYNEYNKQRNYSNNKIFNKKPMKELLINDNTDFSINQLLINGLTINKKYSNGLNNPNININFNNNKETSSQIINIINIGGNYSMDQNKKKILKTIPKTDLSSIKECTYDTQYTQYNSKPANLQKKSIKLHQHENDNNNIKQYKTKVHKITKLPNKKYSHNTNNWHGNTINVFSSIKGDNSNNNSNNNNNGCNKIVKKYIDHLRNTNKTISSSFTTKKEKGNFIDVNKTKK